jgi:hypothetical protein
VDPSERQKIRATIFRLRQEIELYLLAGSTDGVESRRDQISDLERELQENTTERKG